MLQWYTKVDHICTVPVAYVTGTLVVTRKVFDKLRVEDRIIVSEVLGALTRQMDTDGKEADLAAYRALLDQGIKPVTPSAELVKAWRRSALILADEMAAEGFYSDKLYEKVRAVLPDATVSLAAKNPREGIK